MPRVITFSEYYPKSHPRAGQHTFFKEKLLGCVKGVMPFNLEKSQSFSALESHDWREATPKLHTIRKGNRWKAGDIFSPRVWSGKPYASKQIEICEPIKVVSIQAIRIEPQIKFIDVIIDEDWFGRISKTDNNHTPSVYTLAKYDGLRVMDFAKWFSADFDGQIIHWTDLRY